MSGKIYKDEQLANISLISLTLLTFHLEILGKDNKEVQLQNIPKYSVYILNFNCFPF